MTPVYLSIGSNIEREISVRYGLKALESCYGELQVSPIYECEAYGFDGDAFYNLVVGFETNLEIEEIEMKLKEIEIQSGRKKGKTSYCPRTLDIDLLLYGDLVSEEHDLPRDDVVKYSFVLKPLYDITPDLIHPVEKKSIKALWQQFDDSEQQLTDVSHIFTS
jgi:2-amino-4-hydroxy-6-hydroxymethyldihydropteridine diphosphokinase